MAERVGEGVCGTEAFTLGTTPVKASSLPARMRSMTSNLKVSIHALTKQLCYLHTLPACRRRKSLRHMAPGSGPTAQWRKIERPPWMRGVSRGEYRSDR